jgi:hypothetical protein
MINDKVPPEMVITAFIQNILPYRERIANQDDKFFMENATIFGAQNAGRANHFKMIWKSARLDADDRKIIWKWFSVHFLH